jgi:phosphopantetheine adenylyltransferase
MDEQENIAKATENTETGSVNEVDTKMNQAEKAFSQEDVDRIIQNRLKQVEKKYENIDIEEYNGMKIKQAEAEKANMIKREQFEELLQKQKSEYDTKLNSLQGELHKTKVDGALLEAASRHKAVNPTHISNLMKNQVKLGENGTVEVLDEAGNVRYNTETAEPVSVDEAVKEFITQNTYLRSAVPSGAGTGATKGKSASGEVKIDTLDMKKPEDRKIYAEYRKKAGIA